VGFGSSVFGMFNTVMTCFTFYMSLCVSLLVCSDFFYV